ncbi:MAG: 16S rRNA (guanine(966)-N(2))-methyltransferase RsmD [Legionellales bacterium]|nr:16S rRNA (guanine(966)-N(2))-methyltransferase RsmD [Legionellales bacterium]|tara:strand:- start:43 stop:600 length:558 start_codon:yes stop_codon:yes gene_type:complete
MNNNQVSIIGGLWRGQKISFSDFPGLRPTPNRVKETLFNWLSADIIDAICLDLFAGSGALGFEALSRGAKQVTFIDDNYLAIQAIRKNAKRLNVTNAHFMHGKIPKLTLDINCAYDIIFIDPPFKHQLVNPSIAWLEQHHYLKINALIYIEQAIDDEPILVPSNWQVLREKQAGMVSYTLFQKLS